MAKRRWRHGKGGRPPVLDADGHRISRSKTTRKSRLSPPDFGTKEVRRLREIVNGRVDLPVDPLGSLYSRSFIDQRQYDAGRLFAGLTHLVRAGWGLRDGSVAGLWRAVTTGEGIVVVTANAMNGDDRSAIERARSRLLEMRAVLREGRCNEGDRILTIVTNVCIDSRWEGWCRRLLCQIPELPGDWRCLGDLRKGLSGLAELGASRRREISPACVEAAK